MKLTGEKLIAQPREAVWAALNDPEVLRIAIPGCDRVEQVSDDEYKIAMAVAVGPVKAKFQGKLLLSDRQYPASYALAFEGTGGAVGFGKGLATVELEEADDGGTLLRYGASAQVGGRIAQVGARLIDGVANRMAGEFFGAFEQHMAAQAAGDSPGDEPAPEADEADAADGQPAAEARSRWKFWEKRAS